MRRYCSRCLQTLGSLDPERCPSAACRAPRPAREWPSFLATEELIDGRYVMAEILGAGGAGITYRCRDLRRGVDVALKVLHDDRRNGVLANRLAIEGELLELLHHEHIVPFHALKLVGDGPIFVSTAYMLGGSLEGWMRRRGPLAPRAVVQIGRQLALALDFIHAQGIVHRDIKPGNVLLEGDDPLHPQVRLADFGIARVFADQRPMAGPAGLTQTGAFIGTPEYAAPEQIRGERGIGPAADAFALGALLHFIASGQPLLRRSEIADWSAFRERRRDPADRARLVDLVEAGLVVGHRPELDLLDEVIDALLQPEVASRADLGQVALRLGARREQLAAHDLALLAPRTLVHALDEEWGDGEVVEALVPQVGDAEDDPTIIPELASLPNLASLIAWDDMGPRSGPATVLGRRRPPSVVGHAVPPPGGPGPAVVPAPEEATDDQLPWPFPARRRRDSLFLAVSLLVAAGVGVAFGWTGGLPAFLGAEALAALPPSLREQVQRFAVEPPRFVADPVWAGKVVRPEGASAPWAPAPVVAAAGTPTLFVESPRGTKVAAGATSVVESSRVTKVVAGPKRATKATEPKRVTKTTEPKRVTKTTEPKRVTKTTEPKRATKTTEPVTKATKAVAPPPVTRTMAAPSKPAVVRKAPAVVAPAPPGLVERWAADPEDHREIAEVVREEVGQQTIHWLASLGESVDDFDARAVVHHTGRNADEARRDQLNRAWAEQIEQARRLAASPEHPHHAGCATDESDEIASFE